MTLPGTKQFVYSPGILRLFLILELINQEKLEYNLRERAENLEVSLSRPL